MNSIENLNILNKWKNAENGKTLCSFSQRAKATNNNNNNKKQYENDGILVFFYAIN